MTFFRAFMIGLFTLLASASASHADDAPSKILLNAKEFTLKNGMLFLVVERHKLPQVACRVTIRAGSALEENGKTGIAHMLEHMMFKGTKNFGTLDYKKDRDLQERIEAAYQVILSEQRKRNPDSLLIQAKLKEMEELRLEVQKIYVPQAFSSQLGRNGAVEVNAFTSEDETQYLMAVPSDMMEQWFSIVSEQLFEPSWREFYVEKEVVQREWAFRYVNSPEGAAWLDLHATAYTAHPYRNPTIGWKSDMENFNTKDAVEFHKKYYNPSNSVCVLVGDITLEKARQLAEIYFERYPPGPRSSESVTSEPTQQGPRKSFRFLNGAKKPQILIGFHSAPMASRDFFAMDALTMVLSHGRSARFTQDIVNKGLAVEAWAYHPDNRYGGMFILGGSPHEPEDLKKGNGSEEEMRLAYLKTCEDFEKTLIAEVEKLKTALVSQRELERIKKLSYRDLLDKLRRNEDLATTLATFEVQVGWRYLTTYVDKISEITPEDIRRVVKKYIRLENQTSVYVIPGGKQTETPQHYQEIRSVSGSAATMAERPKDFSNHSIYATPPGWKHPLSFDRQPKKIAYEKPWISDTDSATAFYLPDRELPLIDLTLLVKAGSVDVSDAKHGLTQVLSDTLIPGGTERHPPAEFAMILDENAIRLSLSVEEECSTVRMSVLDGEWDKGLALLEELLAHPRFEVDMVSVAKEQLVTGLRRQAGDARAVSKREALIWHFKGHPYGRDPLEGLETIPRISREDLAAFLRTYFVPNNIVACVSGNIEKDRALRSLEKFLHSLGGGKAPERHLEDPKKTPPVLALVHKPGQVQSQVIMLLPSVKRTDPEYWKLSLLMHVFGGGDSLMYTRLRDDLGLVYTANFQQAYRWNAGILVGYFGCRADKTGEAIVETTKIMTTLGSRVPQEDLELKRLDALNSFVFNVDTPAELVDTYGRYSIRKEPLDTLERIQDAYMTATAEELEKLARSFLAPQTLQIFIVADKTTPVRKEDGKSLLLEEDLKSLSQQLGLPYIELPLR